MILNRSRLLELVEKGWRVIAVTDETDPPTPLLLEVTLKREDQQEIRFVES